MNTRYYVGRTGDDPEPPPWQTWEVLDSTTGECLAADIETRVDARTLAGRLNDPARVEGLRADYLDPASPSMLHADAAAVEGYMLECALTYEEWLFYVELLTAARAA